MPNSGSMLVKRRRRCANINPTLNSCLMFVDSCPDVVLMLGQRRIRLPNLKTSSGNVLYSPFSHPLSKHERHWPNVVLMLAHRLRRRSNIIITLGQCLVFAKQLSSLYPAVAQHWANVSGSWAMITALYCMHDNLCTMITPTARRRQIMTSKVDPCIERIKNI